MLWHSRFGFCSKHDPALNCKVTIQKFLNMNGEQENLTVNLTAEQAAGSGTAANKLPRKTDGTKFLPQLSWLQGGIGTQKVSATPYANTESNPS